MIIGKRMVRAIAKERRITIRKYCLIDFVSIGSGKY
jgi:hypothetical protein